MKIDGIGNIAKNVLEQGAGEVAKRANPMNLFGGDTMNAGGGSGLFPNKAGGRGSIEDLLAAMSAKGKDKANFDAGSAAEGLFKGGLKAAGEGVAGAGASQGIQQAMGAIMGIVKQILPMIMGMLGGL